MSQVEVFQCPECREFIASDAKACRFCLAPLDPEIVQVAVNLQAKENKTYRRKDYTKHMVIGGGIFVLGLSITVGSYFLAASLDKGGSYFIDYGMMLGGGADFMYGLVGHVSELRSS